MKVRATKVRKSSSQQSLSKILTTKQKDFINKEKKKLIKEGKDIVVREHFRHVTKQGSETFKVLKIFETQNKEMRNLVIKFGINNLSQNLVKKHIKILKKLFDI